ncbi:hypothetical protein JL475_23215 [Streptomyces sp. M2CJ-2]|nr:hypothetical protein [Streptomyces sp. M2CJ-2]
MHRPDAGQVLLDGEPVVYPGPGDARDAGIAVIYVPGEVQRQDTLGSARRRLPAARLTSS